MVNGWCCACWTSRPGASNWSGWDGILLVTGPTGSGKTTSLYAALNHLNDRTRNILTVEDPIEYHLPGIGQTPVNPKVEMTFARGLRAILRQDPDVVMVGEIRDRETAAIAVQASLTGHLVLSTLHTNSAAAAHQQRGGCGDAPAGHGRRCLSAGLIAGRRAGPASGPHSVPCMQTCAGCGRRGSSASLQRLGLTPQATVTLFKAVGCPRCQQGYRGRTGLYELMGITPALAQMIHDGVGEAELARQARRSIGPSLFQDGQRLVLEGRTSLDELLRVTQED